MIEAPLTLAQLHSFHNAVAPVFIEKWETAADNERKMLANNWSDELRKQMKDRDRYPFSMPTALSALQRIISTQEQSRQSWKAEASSDPNDEIGAEVATITLRDYERRENMPYIESDVFKDGVGVTFGYDKFVVVKENGRDTIKNIKGDYLNLVWDLNDTTPDLSKVNFIAEIERVPKYEAEAQGIDTEGDTDTYDSLVGRENIDYWGTGYEDDKTISVFHHYHRTKKTYHVVLCKDTHNIFGFKDVVILKTKDKKQADELKTSIELAYGLAGLDPTDEVSVEVEYKFEYDYYKFTYNKLIEYKETGEEFHPFNVYFAIRMANDWISVMDMMASPQLFIDRIYSQIDYSFRAELKNVYEFNINAKADGETRESVTKKITKTGGVIYKKGAENVITPVESKGFNPQYMQIISVMSQAIVDMMGGNNAQGLKESASESGRAVALRQSQGKLVAYLFLDNLTRYKAAKGRKLLSLIKKYDTTERIIKVIGGDLDPTMLNFLMQSGAAQPSLTSPNKAYMYLNRGVASFQNADLDLVIDVAPLNEYERQAKLDQFAMAERNAPFLLQSPTWMQLKLELLDIPKADKAKLINEIRTIMVTQARQQAQLDNPKETNELNDVNKIQ